MKKILLLLANCLLALAGWSQVGDVVQVERLDGTLGQIVQNATVTVRDDKFFTPEYKAKLTSAYLVRNSVALRIKEERPVLLPVEFQATVKVQIAYRNFNNQVTTIEKDLSLQYKADSIYAYSNQFDFEGGHEVEVKVLEVQTNVDTSVWRSLILLNTLQAFPDYDLSLIHI